MLRRKRKVVHFIRHGEAAHNVPPYDVKRRDPYLTPHGQDQAQALGQQFPNLEDVELIVCSPMKRAIQTALLAFADHLKATKTQLVALPELQELSGNPCDTGSSLAELLTEFREHPLDLSLVPHDWDSKDRLWSPTEVRTLARMARARTWLRERPESNIIAVGHAHCMQLLVRDAPNDYENDGIAEIKLGLLPVWRNCELRTFAIDEDKTHVLLFDETKTSRKLKAKGENVPRVGEDGKARKDSETSNESSKDRTHKKHKSRWSTLSRSSSRAPSTAESSPASSIKKSLSWPNKPSSIKEPRKVGSHRARQKLVY